MENLELFSLVSMIVLIVLCVLLIIITDQAISIRKILMRQYTHLNAENEAAIAKLQGDSEAHLKFLYRAMYFYWITSPYIHSASNHELLKREMKQRYFDQITKAGGKFPEKYLPADQTSEKLKGIEALYKAGQYSKEEYEAEKKLILKK